MISKKGIDIPIEDLEKIAGRLSREWGVSIVEARAYVYKARTIENAGLACFRRRSGIEHSIIMNDGCLWQQMAAHSYRSPSNTISKLPRQTQF